MEQHKVAGLILAGGRSTRMGTDKALLHIDGKPLLYRLVKQLSRLTQEVIISVGTKQQETIYRQCLGELENSVRFAADLYPDCGPLSGLHAGLLGRVDGYLFVMACDMPNVSEEVLGQLTAHMDSGAEVIHVAGQPFHALYHTGAITQIEAALNEQDYRLQRLLQRLFSVQVKLAADVSSAVFANLNTPEDYNKYAAK
ncbi:hypothetical protein BK133_06320 [Paenibacillus sp. FSL H8-0548]|uniref:molybdenum cofactor guanylyltransferase n=1 Tax=Paenibacillus sp. FSL H8-0548 TaxID=1920422 RepID=UPI00096ECF3F|nr:molybdenum cofactor guanylyltransferase [Paenibacillus sp. FSL H8-0548]OMF37217.1 hypothetical protein BK133_06320 [Paenibacillus sp. FSL H8-0548]